MTDVRLGGAEQSGLRLFRLFGIEIRLDWSVLIIFGLIVYSLGSGLFPQWHPDWSAGTAWLTAFAAGVIFFVSLLAHELAHSLMARRYGIRVPRITLFLFGGMAEIEAEARTPKQEFAIAVVGPLTSLVIGVLFTLVATWAMDQRVVSSLTDDPGEAVAAMSPWITAFVWLGSVNVMLAVFNMVPGFPLDGGRVFRALVWWITGDPVRATRLASNAGRIVGWLIIAYGVWNVLALGNLGGLWLVFIGWFLTHLARTSYSQLLTERSLRSVRVQDVMRTRFDSVPADVSLDDFVEDFLLRSGQHLWPVTDAGHVIGTIAFSDVARVPAAERRMHRVRDLLTPLDEHHSLPADEMASTALRRLAGMGDNPVVVVQGGRVVGLVRAGDILRWTLIYPAGEQ
ncbi:MAG TPA: site-2 protease family protein [Pseudomonadales bacterium]